jgi:hypothetical protein
VPSMPSHAAYLPTCSSCILAYPYPPTALLWLICDQIIILYICILS